VIFFFFRDRKSVRAGSALIPIDAFPGCLGIAGAGSRLDRFGLGPRLPFRPRDDPLRHSLRINGVGFVHELRVDVGICRVDNPLGSLIRVLPKPYMGPELRCSDRVSQNPKEETLYSDFRFNFG